MRASIAWHVLALAWLIAAPALWPWAVGCVVLNHLIAAVIGMWPRSTWLGPNITRLPAAAAARNQIVLTIDDGPDPAVTPRVLELLDRHNAKATFFCIGDRALRQPELCRDIVERGHTIENHTQRHSYYFAFSSIAAYTREIGNAQANLARLSGRTPRFFRAPAGIRSPFLDPALSKLGLRLVAWTRRGFDTVNGDPLKILHRLIPAVKAGAILLLHDGRAARTSSGAPVILEVLPAILNAGTAAGLHWVTLSEAMETPAA